MPMRLWSMVVIQLHRPVGFTGRARRPRLARAGAATVAAAMSLLPLVGRKIGAGSGRTVLHALDLLPCYLKPCSLPQTLKVRDDVRDILIAGRGEHHLVARLDCLCVL